MTPKHHHWDWIQSCRACAETKHRNIHDQKHQLNRNQDTKIKQDIKHGTWDEYKRARACLMCFLTGILPGTVSISLAMCCFAPRVSLPILLQAIKK